MTNGVVTLLMASVLDVTLKRGQNMNLNYNKMNALKFQNIREKRQECFNVDEYTFNDFDFDGKRRKVYSNVNLSIFTDDYCNANCKFCVAQLRFENKGKMYKKSPIRPGWIDGNTKIANMIVLSNLLAIFFITLYQQLSSPVKVPISVLPRLILIPAS